MSGEPRYDTSAHDMDPEMAYDGHRRRLVQEDDDKDQDEPAPEPSYRSMSPSKLDSPSKIPPYAGTYTGGRPDSPASSVGTSATASSSSGAGAVGYKSNLGLLGGTGKDTCRRCGSVVYFAEKVMAGGHKWHKRCLRCANCSKALDSHLVEKDNLPYCKKCYDEAWGLRSQGFVLRPGLH